MNKHLTNGKKQHQWHLVCELLTKYLYFIILARETNNRRINQMDTSSFGFGFGFHTHTKFVTGLGLPPPHFFIYKIRIGWIVRTVPMHFTPVTEEPLSHSECFGYDALRHILCCSLSQVPTVCSVPIISNWEPLAPGHSCNSICILVKEHLKKAMAMLGWTTYKCISCWQLNIVYIHLHIEIY